MAGTSQRTIRTTCNSLSDKGFIQMIKFRTKGQAWNRIEYILCWPPGFDIEDDDYIDEKLNERETYREENFEGYEAAEY